MASKLDKIYQYLLIGAGFSFPLSIALGNLFFYTIALIWLVSGDYKNKFLAIKSNKVFFACLFFFLAYLIGLLWTDDVSEGLHVVRKMMPYVVVLPILISIVKKEYVKYYIAAFLASMIFSHIVSYLMWFEIIPLFKNATLEDPVPFISRISYNPLLAFSIYIILNNILFGKLKTLSRYFHIFLAISMSINIFITGGRAGQVAYFVMLFLLVFQFFNKKILKSLVVATVLVTSSFSLAYLSSNLFQNRVNSAISNVQNFNQNKNTSVGLRIVFLINSLDVIKENIMVGVGTGDFPKEYEKVHIRKNPNAQYYEGNPHNMYALVGAQLGILGILLMLHIFYRQVCFSLYNPEKIMGNIGVALPIFFLIIMLSDIYLYLHYTKFLFIFFSAFLYKNFEIKN